MVFGGLTKRHAGARNREGHWSTFENDMTRISYQEELKGYYRSIEDELDVGPCPDDEGYEVHQRLLIELERRARRQFGVKPSATTHSTATKPPLQTGPISRTLRHRFKGQGARRVRQGLRRVLRSASTGVGNESADDGPDALRTIGKTRPRVRNKTIGELSSVTRFARQSSCLPKGSP